MPSMHVDKTIYSVKHNCIQNKPPFPVEAVKAEEGSRIFMNGIAQQVGQSSIHSWKYNRGRPSMNIGKNHTYPFP